MKKNILLLILLTYLFPAAEFGAFAQDGRQDRAMAHYNKGNELSGRAEYALAVKEYDETISLLPDYYRAYFQRGNAYYLSGDYRKAIEDYDTAIKLSPDYADAYYNRGVASFNKGEIEKAAGDWEQTLKISPNHASARQDLNNARLCLEVIRQSASPAQLALKDAPCPLEEKQKSAAPDNEAAWIEYTKTPQYLRIARLLSEDLLQFISPVTGAPRTGPDFTLIPPAVAPRRDINNASGVMEELRPARFFENTPAAYPSVWPRPTITIYNYPYNDDTTRMELNIPDSDLKIITDFPGE